MLMIGILDVAIVGIVLLLLLWLVPNVVRYLAHKTGEEEVGCR